MMKNERHTEIQEITDGGKGLVTLKVSVIEEIPGGVQCLGTALVSVSRADMERAPETLTDTLKVEAQAIIDTWEASKAEPERAAPVVLEDFLAKKIKL